MLGEVLWAPVLAQVAAPQPLAPPVSLFPAKPAPSEAPVEAAPEASDQLPEVSGIDVDRLADFDPDSVGTLDAEGGGFGADLWRGSDRRWIEALLERLTTARLTPAARDLARRLLLSEGTAPAGPDQADGADPGRFLRLRIARLLDLGAFDGLRDLAALVPQRFDEEPMARARVLARLLAGELAQACPQVRQGVGQHGAEIFWRQALVICQLAAGESEQATLGLDLMREGGRDEEVAFAALAAPSGTTEAALSMATTPLGFVLLRAAGTALPPGFVATADPILLAAVARSPDFDPDQRVQAAEWAVVAGTAGPAAVTRIYDGFSFAQDELDNAISLAPSLPGARGRALLYQVARAQTLPSIRAEVIQVALSEAAKDGLFAMAAQLYGPLLAENRPSVRLLWFAETAGRALYAAGEAEAGTAWYAVARAAAANSVDAAGALVGLWPFARLTGDEGGPEGGGEVTLATWGQARAEVRSGVGRQQRLLLAAFGALNQAAGAEPTNTSWPELLPDAAAERQVMPDAALLLALRAAAGAGRRGETLLLALSLLGRVAPVDLHPVAFGDLLAALAEIGLRDEARALAVEAAVAQGI